MKNPWRTAICALLLCGAFALGCLPAQAAGAAPAMEGRTGLVYTCARSFLGFTWTRTMIVDEQTGLCLAWRAQSAIGDYSLSDGAGDFLCTDFVTQDVALPLSLEGQAA